MAPHSSLRVVIFGATGNQGGSVLRTLAPHKTAYRIRAVTRTLGQAKVKELSQQMPHVEWVEADLDDIKSISRAVAGADVVFGVTPSVQPSRLRKQGKPLDTEFEQGKRLVDTCVEQKVKMLVFSTLPSPQKISGGQITGVNHYENKYRIQQYLLRHKTTMQTAAIQLAVYYQNNMQNARWSDEGTEVVFGYPGHPDRKLAYADVERDTGAMVKYIVDNRDMCNGKVYPVVSGYYSPRDIAMAFTSITGICARAVEVPLCFVKDSNYKAMFEFYAGYDMFAESALDTDQALTTPERFWKASGFHGPPKSVCL
ncbi:hypothetical protein H4R99_003726 [Coemansia sp. RSA 1722]|nr:hypothetical protein LPJ57_002892 [Coemansia sp. RSA 486]KAJ2237698.1 hypothetical protein IWW45_000704 [Coemansia sp. RSA 485]KAJ2599401.1 hypothetical protein H4R99_003726 [Coemansia sp. RSA 1722]KAJ2634860.1 hypothetical protein GGF40_003950 [Coemansia sp. RSA 1286]